MLDVFIFMMITRGHLEPEGLVPLKHARTHARTQSI